MSEEAKIGALFDADVEDLGSDGRGVVLHPSGRRIFASGICVGERARFKIVGLKGRVGFAQCIEVLRSSPARQPAFCPHHGFAGGDCGGCPWQFMTYEEQLLRKQARVEREFCRLDGKINVLPILPSPKKQGYRNRAQLKTDGQQIGFISAASQDLAAINDCPVLTEKNRATLAALQARLPNPDWRPSPKALRKKDWTTLDIDEDLDARSVSVNQRRPFRQANSEQNETMRNWLHGKLNTLEKNCSVIELFCGSGNLTEIIAAQGFNEILAIEGVEEAVRALKAKALANVKTQVANLFDEAKLAAIFSHQRDAEILVLDPPRDGLKIKQGLLPKKSNLKEVFYISCDLATLIRDVGFFIENKFTVREAQPLDQFPHTPHIELMLHLSRKK